MSRMTDKKNRVKILAKNVAEAEKVINEKHSNYIDRPVLRFKPDQSQMDGLAHIKTRKLVKRNYLVEEIGKRCFKMK